MSGLTKDIILEIGGRSPFALPHFFKKLVVLQKNFPPQQSHSEHNASFYLVKALSKTSIDKVVIK